MKGVRFPPDGPVRCGDVQVVGQPAPVLIRVSEGSSPFVAAQLRVAPDAGPKREKTPVGYRTVREAVHNFDGAQVVGAPALTFNQMLTGSIPVTVASGEWPSG